ncbi:protein-export chaperone SecB [Amaricoccus solimangrovi]|uniref:Protein-export protein SecB n=1 Tax=Amaricoccus solimangrovi TaxID=2589815 RepID=A0A501WWC8_9RHOB|nr:protein-export chaperone SecB [Amaricoccus solimangrovi]TPE52545.1 protein-export chaperone SecB [Amaricoccus solimangrovi]
MAEENGAQDNAAQQAQAQPRLSILTQYVRDLSFENIAAQKGVASPESAPEISIKVNVEATGRGEDRYEVAIKLTVNSAIQDAPVFIVELDYAGLFLIQNMPQDQLHPLMMIECPRLIFPFARRVISDVTRDGGFPPLNLEPIDFLGLYRAELARRQAAQATPAQA